MMRFLPGPEALFAFALIVAGPAILARFFVATSWLQVGCAFLVWTFLLLLLLGGGASRNEAIGWTIIVSMFSNWLTIPLTALILRLLDVPYRFMQ
jgi:hypothetical protein